MDHAKNTITSEGDIAFQPKLDRSGYSYTTRSYGVGNSVGLVDSFQPTPKGYRYSEIGHLQREGKSANWSLDVYTTHGFFPNHGTSVYAATALDDKKACVMGTTSLALESMVDSVLGALSAAQLVVLSESYNIAARLDSPAYRISTSACVLANFVLNGVVSLVVLAEIVRMWLWREAPDFNPMDVGNIQPDLLFSIFAESAFAFVNLNLISLTRAALRDSQLWTSCTMAAAYQHTPLEFEDSIRLLDLLPSSEANAPLQCRIRQVRLSEARSRYEALSYVWRDAQGSRPILCDGRELLVTSNCHDAMVRLRQRHFRVRTLWIDQSPVEVGTRERNHQVKLMGEIYHNASTVLIWLGPEDVELGPRYCIPSLHFIVFMQFHFRRMLLRIPHIRDNFFDGPSEEVIDKIRLRIDARLLATYDWESHISSASQHHWGKRGLKLLNSTQDLILNFRDRALYIGGWKPRNSIISRHDWSERGLRLLSSTPGLDSRIPHDKIYGIYSILRNMDIQLPDPEYSKRIERVLEEFARACISGFVNLNLITSGIPAPKHLGRPSWIPNLLGPEPYKIVRSQFDKFADQSGSIAIFNTDEASGTWCTASARSTASAPSECLLGTLPVQGKRIGGLATTLACESEQESDTFELQNFKDFIYLCYEWCQVCRTMPNSNNVVALSLFSGWGNSLSHWKSAFPAWRDVMFYPYCPETTRREIENSTAPSPEMDPAAVVVNYLTANNDSHSSTRADASRFQRIVNHSANWAFAITDNGYTGRAYATCRKGDQLWLLQGSRLPVILRQVAEGYRYVAPAYFYDMMKGQLWPEEEEELETLTLV
ncbi:HET-domain-containing protein [Apiospora phragmitis]|uniref:HET-domain-containing protein n=1 Tax=Apiospora phragmitis TaxID=2905665 RepID=A0ABR1VG98_9PEZI